MTDISRYTGTPRAGTLVALIALSILPRAFAGGDCNSATCEQDPCTGGALGTYFNNTQFTGLAMVRRDATIDFDWGGGSPGPAIDNETFGVRWQAEIRPPFTGNYTFYTTTDDGVRLWVDGQLLIEEWYDFAPTEFNGSINLLGGSSYQLTMEYFEKYGGAVAQLQWEGPGLPKQVIGPQYMHHPGVLDCDKDLVSDACEIVDDPELDSDLNGILDSCGIEAVLPQGLKGFAGNHKVSLTWKPFEQSATFFDHFAVYRQTKLFTSVAELDPIAEIADHSATAFEDVSAENGTSYFYAVTAVRSDASEIEEVSPLGPRTPRDETDLQVASIARTPRYPRYDALYNYYEVTDANGFGPYGFSAAFGLGSGQTESTQRFPNIGQPVTYMATVRNRGTNPWTGTLLGMFSVDGADVAGLNRSGTIQPGDTAEFALVRAWDGQSHEIGFRIDPNDERTENDSLAIDTKSVAFLSYIDASRIEAFYEETANYPSPTTDDFIDWLNGHMHRFNELFELAGTDKRVHFDILEVLSDDAPDPPIDTLPFAIFPFRYYEWEGSLRLSGYYDPAEDLDYGLLHEMGHQLGLIDLYQLDLPPDWNEVSGTGYSAVPCLMNGSSHFLSEHSALAMQHWIDVAHGYFGQYLYSIPSQLRMRFIGSDGAPLQNAKVSVYQKTERSGIGQILTDQVKFAGTTDSEGFYFLPNVEVDELLVPVTFAGDELNDNPFGHVAVVGYNGLLLFKVEDRGSVDYAWLDITEVNVAYWHGETELASFERRLALGGPIQLCPPDELTEQNADSWAKWGDQATVTLHDDYDQKEAGLASLRLETNGGFDTYARYPGNRIARWDLTNVENLRMRFYAENPHGFQERSPWLRIGSREGFIELRTEYDILNDAIGQWTEFVVPIEGDALWHRTEIGAPDLSAVNWIEIHADTWDFGYTLWMDGVAFSPLCDVDLEDHASFVACLAGPVAPAPTGCGGSDVDANLHVDLLDFQSVQSEFTGSRD